MSFLPAVTLILDHIRGWWQAYALGGTRYWPLLYLVPISYLYLFLIYFWFELKLFDVNWCCSYDPITATDHRGTGYRKFRYMALPRWYCGTPSPHSGSTVRMVRLFESDSHKEYFESKLLHGNNSYYRSSDLTCTIPEQFNSHPHLFRCLKKTCLK